MAFTGQEDHRISLNDAAALTKRYREAMTANQIKGGFFGKDALQAILDQTDCVGIRYYYGLHSNGRQVMVLVGAITNQDDLVDGELAEVSLPCPNWCGTDNELNNG